MKKNLILRIFLGTIFILLTVQIFAQSTLDEKLEQIFYELPLRYDMEDLIDSAFNIKGLECDRENTNISKLRYQGRVKNHKYVFIDFESCHFEIFRADSYSINGEDLDNLDVVSLDIHVDNRTDKEIKSEYKRLVKNLKKETAKSYKY